MEAKHALVLGRLRPGGAGAIRAAQGASGGGTPGGDTWGDAALTPSQRSLALEEPRGE